MSAGKITAIAFDLAGVLIEENDYPLSPEEQVLERQFGYFNSDKEFYSWAKEELGTTQDKVEKMIQTIFSISMTLGSRKSSLKFHQSSLL
jgi:hypothetical protein